MRVLVACEESQTVTKEFRSLGHEAFSCDVRPCSGGFPDWHIQGDVRPLLSLSWDMIIAFPPCTYLTNAGSCRLRVGGSIQAERFELARQAREFFMLFYDSSCSRVCIENPVPGRIHALPPYSQIVQPYMFGEPWLKRTCLWLRGLPLLFATDVVQPDGLWVGASSSPGSYSLSGHRSSLVRSKTFPGVARAMAAQWGGALENLTI